MQTKLTQSHQSEKHANKANSKSSVRETCEQGLLKVISQGNMQTKLTQSHQSGKHAKKANSKSSVRETCKQS